MQPCSWLWLPLRVRMDQPLLRCFAISVTPNLRSKQTPLESTFLHTGGSLTPKTSRTSRTGCLFFFLSVWVYVLYLFFTAAAWVRVSVDRRALPSSSSFPEIRVDNPTSCNHSASSSPSGNRISKGRLGSFLEGYWCMQLISG